MLLSIAECQRHCEERSNLCRKVEYTKIMIVYGLPTSFICDTDCFVPRNDEHRHHNLTALNSIAQHVIRELFFLLYSRVVINGFK
jgi:hypothetical protein